MTYEPSTTARQLSALCNTCRSVFVQPDRPLKERVDISHNEKSYISSTEPCLLCGILQKKGWKRPPHLFLSFENGKFHLVAEGTEEERKKRSLMMQLFPVVNESHSPIVDLSYVDSQSTFKLNTNIASDNTEDAVCSEQIQRWVKICTQKHQLCRKGHADNRRAILPTRLIDVQDLKVIITASHSFKDPNTRYATLTHRWIQPNNAKLLGSNLKQLTERIDPGFLSPVFQDAITAAGRLDIQYIWIDSLCIVQDDLDDWARESSLMGLVYQNAFINIGASGAAEQRSQQSGSDVETSGNRYSSPRMFTSRDSREYTAPCVNIIRVGHNQTYYGTRPEHDRVSKELIRRGWVFQERLLSPRSVYFDKLLTWECPELLANELLPRGMPLEKPDDIISHQTSIRLETFLERSRSKYSTYGNGVRISETYWTWLALVSMYKECHLTFESDILPALSGLAKNFNEIIDDEYVAGIWRGDMIRGLLWRVHRRSRRGPVQKPLREYHAPSWSWASAAAAGELVGFIHTQSSENATNEVFLAKVLDVNLTMVSSDPMGQIKDGHMRISGHLRSRQEVGPCIQDEYDSEYESYDDVHQEKCLNENTLYFALTLQSKPRRVRGLIIEATCPILHEYRRLGVFSVDPDTRLAFKDEDIENLQGHTITII